MYIHRQILYLTMNKKLNREIVYVNFLHRQIDFVYVKKYSTRKGEILHRQNGGLKSAAKFLFILEAPISIDSALHRDNATTRAENYQHKSHPGMHACTLEGYPSRSACA